MAAHKTSIALPEDLLREVDRAAQERGESRSRFVARVLAQAVRARRDAAITRRLDALFAGEEGRQEQQLSVARQLEQASTAWDNENWVR